MDRDPRGAAGEEIQGLSTLLLPNGAKMNPVILLTKGSRYPALQGQALAAGCDRPSPRSRGTGRQPGLVVFFFFSLSVWRLTWSLSVVAQMLL